METTQTTTTETMNCFKCGGRGRIVGFSHIDSGKCFQCGGAGWLNVAAVPKQKRQTVRRPDRAKCINEIANLLRVDGVTDYTGETDSDNFRITDEIGYFLFCAPADVRARGLAAFRRVVSRRHAADFFARVEARMAAIPAIEEAMIAKGAIDAR